MAEYDPDRLMTERPPADASMTIRPRQLSRDQVTQLVRKYNPDITPAAVEGEVDNIERESGGKSAVPGDFEGGRATSGGLYQHHNERLTGLKAFAAKHGGDWTDPEIQIQYSRLEKERDYPSLLRLQQSTNNRGVAEDSFKRIFERPASTLWQHDAGGRPVQGSEGSNFRFSDYAMKENADNQVFMTPQEYLDLTPPLETKPFENPSGRSLMRSFERGEPIEQVPSLDVDVSGPTATVTDQDGRHRALLAQQQGAEAIPVTINQTGKGDPKEIIGANGTMMAHDFPKVQAYQEPQQQPKEPISLLGEIGQAIMPRAEAAEAPQGDRPAWAADEAPAQGAQDSPPAWAADEGQQAPPPPGAEAPDPSWSPERQRQWMEQQQGRFSGAIEQGISKGVGNTVFGGEELLGKGMEALGVPGGQALTEDARTRMAAEEGKIAPLAATNPAAAGIGEFLGGMVAPGGAATGLARNALARGAIAGATSGILAPGDKDNYWGSKALQMATGAGVGAVTGGVGNALSNAASGSLRPAVSQLVREGVQLTPGQMKGGAAKRAEDVIASMPGVGSVIRNAQRRSIETFNRAAINRSLSDINSALPSGMNAGHDAIGFAQDEFTRAYNQVIPQMRATIDPAFQRDMNAIYLRAQQANLPQEHLDKLQHTINQEILEPFRLGYGAIDGTSSQKIGTQLDRIIGRAQNSEDPYVRDMGRYLREADRSLDRMMQRQNPALQTAKDRIDAGYAKFKIVQDAAGRAQAKDAGVFTPAQLHRAVSAADTSKDNARTARGLGVLKDMSIAANEVLPQTVPDSGTPERLALMGLLGGGGYFHPGTAALLGGLAVPYTAPASRALNAAVNRLASLPGPRRAVIASATNALANAGAMGAGSAAANAMQPVPNPP
jgi:hypothetical protein